MEGSPDLSRYLVKFESFGKKFEYYFLAKNLEVKVFYMNQTDYLALCLIFEYLTFYIES